LLYSLANCYQSGDERLQNLDFRDDTVLDGIPDPEEPLPTDVFGTPGNDIFDTVTPYLRFEGNNQNLFTGGGNDTVDVTFALGGNRIDLGSGDDLLFAGTNNRILAGSGNDRLFLGSGGGNNLVTGGAGADQFWLVTDQGDLPEKLNTITDFNLSQRDVLGFGGTDLQFADLDLVQMGRDTVIRALGQDVAKLLNTQASSLTSNAFVFA
jgi:Ca2+-binding RTX toxin-like protein